MAACPSLVQSPFRTDFAVAVRFTCRGGNKLCGRHEQVHLLPTGMANRLAHRDCRHGSGHGGHGGAGARVAAAPSGTTVPQSRPRTSPQSCAKYRRELKRQPLSVESCLGILIGGLGCLTVDGCSSREERGSLGRISVTDSWSPDMRCSASITSIPQRGPTLSTCSSILDSS